MKMEKRFVRVIALLVISAAVLVLSGCLDVDTTITVKPDGSGTVEQTFLMQSDIVAMLKSMGGEESENFSIMDMEEIKSNAQAMGEGVELVSAEQHQENGFEGYKAVYSFEDINKIRVNQNPEDNVPDAGPEEAEDVKEFVTFSLKKGDRSALTIHLPRKLDDTDESDSSEDMPDQDGIEMIKRLYENMHLSMKVAIDGTIRKTNAAHRSGSTITLMEMEFEKIFESKDTFEKLVASNPQSLGEIQELVRDVPGIKVELKETVTVEFD